MIRISSYGRQAAPNLGRAIHLSFFHHDVPISFLGLGASLESRTHFMEGAPVCGPSDRPLGCTGASEVARADPVRIVESKVVCA